MTTTDYRNNTFWCGAKGKFCSYATAYGFCSVTACREAFTNYNESIPETMPDSFIINGVKYVKEDKNE